MPFTLCENTNNLLHLVTTTPPNHIYTEFIHLKDKYLSLKYHFPWKYFFEDTWQTKMLEYFYISLCIFGTRTNENISIITSARNTGWFFESCIIFYLNSIFSYLDRLFLFRDPVIYREIQGNKYFTKHFLSWEDSIKLFYLITWQKQKKEEEDYDSRMNTDSESS